MWVNQIFSLINSTGIIKNVIVCDNYEVANRIAISTYGSGSYAVDTTQYPLYIGCKHIDGEFYHDDGETVISRNLTTDEEVVLALDKIALLEMAQAETYIDADYRLSMIELGLV